MPKLKFVGNERLTIYNGVADDGSRIKVKAGDEVEVDASTAKRLLTDFGKLFKKTSDKKEVSKPPVDRQIKESKTK